MHSVSSLCFFGLMSISVLWDPATSMQSGSRTEREVDTSDDISNQIDDDNFFDSNEHGMEELCLSIDKSQIFSSDPSLYLATVPDDIETVETSILMAASQNVDYRLRPGMNKRTLDVDVSIWVYNIGPISETNMNFRIDFYFTQSWVDERLDFRRFVCNQTNVTFTITREQPLWTPDTYFPNALEAETHSVTQENRAVWLRSDGRVTTSTRHICCNDDTGT
ncbi:gamma-aminobutyric acid receptor subunit alpha-5-like [Symsagittifera roscoffensis]|uniref:gamma-aminobutyric acid receptor subunit alpha-5-like n=1 Tax=Symsagittifera roscoffensis TaxID=84072 RepID=UPI00307C04CC